VRALAVAICLICRRASCILSTPGLPFGSDLTMVRVQTLLTTFQNEAEGVSLGGGSGILDRLLVLATFGRGTPGGCVFLQRFENVAGSSAVVFLMSCFPRRLSIHLFSTPDLTWRAGGKSRCPPTTQLPSAGRLVFIGQSSRGELPWRYWSAWIGGA